MEINSKRHCSSHSSCGFMPEFYYNLSPHDERCQYCQRNCAHSSSWPSRYMAVEYERLAQDLVESASESFMY